MCSIYSQTANIIKHLFQTEQPLFLHSLCFPKDLRILVLAPHPDDFDAIGVTMRFFRENGNPIHVVVLSSGASGVEDSFCSPLTWERKTEIREDEQRQSCRFFGLPDANLTFLRLQEDAQGHLLESDENLERLREYLLTIQPNFIFLPHGNDTNVGHQRTHSMFRKIATNTELVVTAFLIRDPKTITMRNDLYTVFGAEEAAWKARLLRFHQSQHQRNLNTRGHGFDDRILNLNRDIARKFLDSELYAEAFELEFWNQI
jgi:LmbE family N-acetylglucosaminyl deacetylase